MKGHETNFIFHQKTRHQACLIFMPFQFKKTTKKNLFSTLWYLSKSFICYIIRAITLKQVHIVTHSYTASFSIRICFYETNKKNFFSFFIFYFYLRKNVNCFWKWIQNAGNVTLRTFQNFFLCQQLFANKDLYMKTRLCNIFKTNNTKTLIKSTSESPNKLLQMPWKTTTLKQPIKFSRTVQFLATF